MVGEAALVATVAVVAVYATYEVGKAVAVWAKGGRQRVKDTGLSHLSDTEVSERTRDKSLSNSERQRYIKEEKGRKLRNGQKRK